MRGNFGKTLKSIRNNLGLTQQVISEGVISQANYSKIEQDIIEPSFLDIYMILKNINMTVDEFLHIHNHGEIIYSNLDKLISYGLDREKLKKLEENINKQEQKNKLDLELLLIIKSLTQIQSDDWTRARLTAVVIRDRLLKQDNLYYTDLIILNAILFVFPLEIAHNIYLLCAKKIEKFQHNEKYINLLSNMKSNLILIMINEREYLLALSKLNELISEFRERKYLLKLATAYIRKGYLLTITNKNDGDQYIKKGFSILGATNQTERIKNMQNEIKTQLKEWREMSES